MWQQVCTPGHALLHSGFKGRAACAELGGLDIVHNNAGIQYVGPVDTYPEEKVGPFFLPATRLFESQTVRQTTHT